MVTSGGHRQRQQWEVRSPGMWHYNNKGNLKVNTGEEWTGWKDKQWKKNKIKIKSKTIKRRKRNEGELKKEERKKKRKQRKGREAKEGTWGLNCCWAYWEAVGAGQPRATSRRREITVASGSEAPLWGGPLAPSDHQWGAEREAREHWAEISHTWSRKYPTPDRGHQGVARAACSEHIW